MSAAQTIGIDFGTTNTVVSLTGADGQAELVRFAADGAHASTFRSALSFHADADELSGRKVEAGPWAIEAYLDEPTETRLIQSFKSYAASPLFTETTIIGRRYRFEDMLSAFLLRLRAHAGAALAEVPPRVIVGRPVRFADDIAIEKDVARAEFEHWIGRELAAIEGAVDEALTSAALAPAQIDRVFLTGGSSFVPAVRRLFVERFGEERISTGAELESIASGLSLMGAERDLGAWCERAHGASR
jgi:molecular chaperone DnaK (HSP70)